MGLAKNTGVPFKVNLESASTQMIRPVNASVLFNLTVILTSSPRCTTVLSAVTSKAPATSSAAEATAKVQTIESSITTVNTTAPTLFNIMNLLIFAEMSKEF